MTKSKSFKKNKVVQSGNELPRPKMPKPLLSSGLIRPNTAIYPRVSLSIPGQVLKQSITAGGIANVITVNFGLILNWATRFAAVFREYCIVGVCFDIQRAGTAIPGVLKIFYDEKDSGIPTSTGALSSIGYELTLSTTADVGRRRCFEWVAQDYADLGWLIATTSYNIGYLKLYTDSTNYGCSGACDILITPVLQVEFRGYKPQ